MAGWLGSPRAGLSIVRSARQRGTKRREYNANLASAQETGLCDFPLFGVLPGGAETAGRGLVTSDEKTKRLPFFGVLKIDWTVKKRQNAASQIWPARL